MVYTCTVIIVRLKKSWWLLRARLSRVISETPNGLSLTLSIFVASDLFAIRMRCEWMATRYDHSTERSTSRNAHHYYDNGKSTDNDAFVYHQTNNRSSSMNNKQRRPDGQLNNMLLIY